MFTQVFPILSTADLDAALAFYRDLLGARVTFEFPGPDGIPAYVGLELGSSHIGIGRDAAGPSSSDRPAISLWVYAEDCDGAVARLREGGVRIVEEPADQPWVSG